MSPADDEQMVNIRQAMASPDIPHIYFNGFINAVGSSDVTVLLQNNGNFNATLNMSFTMAKSLSRKLKLIIDDLEKNSGNPIMDTDEVAAALALGKEEK